MKNYIRKFVRLNRKNSEYESAKAKEMRKELKKQGINATDDYMRGIEYESAKAKEMRKELKKQGINATDDYMRGILY